MKRTLTHPASRRAFLGTMASAGTALGASILCPRRAYAEHEDGDEPHAGCALLNPIPGGVAPFKPFAIFIHHNPLSPAIPLADLNDPSQITDFHGVVGLTHIRGSGTGTNTDTGETMPLAYQADMGFSQGKFIGTDGRLHKGTFAFV